MAADDGDASESESVTLSESSVNNAKLRYKCCKKLCKVFVCKRCSSLHHESCVRRKYGEDVEHTDFECCESQNSGECDRVNDHDCGLVMVKLENEKLNMQVQLLNDLVRELRDKNDLLKDNNNLLLHRMRYMEDIMSTMSVGDHRKKLAVLSDVNNVNRVQFPMPSASEASGAGAVLMSEIEEDGAAASTRQVSNHRSSYAHALAGTSEVAVAAPLNGRLSGMKAPDVNNDGSVNAVTAQTSVNNSDELLNTGRYRRKHPASTAVHNGEKNQNPEAYKILNSGQENGTSAAADGFVLVGRRRGKRRDKKIGTAEVDGGQRSAGFVGVEKKVWLYLYRVQRHVTEKMISDFLGENQHLKEAEVIVRELPTDASKNKCFVVSAPFSKKDVLYDTATWPAGVGIKRYDFNKMRAYQNNASGVF